jgi:hypothetical protein
MSAPGLFYCDHFQAVKIWSDSPFKKNCIALLCIILELVCRDDDGKVCKVDPKEFRTTDTALIGYMDNPP